VSKSRKNREKSRPIFPPFSPHKAPFKPYNAPFGAFLLKRLFLFYIVQAELSQGGMASRILPGKWRNKMYQDNKQNDLKAHYMGIGMAIGMGIGVVFIVLFGIVLKKPGLIGVGAGMGVSIGIAIGEGLYQRNKEQ
jgi:ABC-type cobalamin transport system permease subunit